MDEWWDDDPEAGLPSAVLEALREQSIADHLEARASWPVYQLDSATGFELSERLDTLNDAKTVADSPDALLLAGLRGVQRARAALAAQELALVAEVTRRRGHDDLQARAVADEIALECGFTRYAADRLQDNALQLGERFTRAFDALAEGRIDLRKAETIAQGLAGVKSESVRARLEELAIGIADGTLLPNGEARPDLMPVPVTGVNVPTLRNTLKVWSLAAEPEVAEERAQKARAARRVVFTPVEDDMVELWALLSADDALKVRAALEQTAEVSRGDGRTADQRRADVLVDLLIGKSSGVTPKTRINVTVPLEVLTGDSKRPGHLDRYGPVTGSLARQIAADAAETGTFRCVITDGAHGTLFGLGKSTFTAKYVAGQALKEHVSHRDRYCRFPGCRAAAASCDFDHRTPHSAGGATCSCNGQPLCAHHHRVKHETGFTVRLPDPARPAESGYPPDTVIWRTPTGRDHVDIPPPVLGAPPF